MISTFVWFKIRNYEDSSTSKRKNVLEAQRIEVIRGCSGDVEELVKAYLEGNVRDNGEICDHHDCH